MEVLLSINNRRIVLNAVNSSFLNHRNFLAAIVEFKCRRFHLDTKVLSLAFGKLRPDVDPVDVFLYRDPLGINANYIIYGGRV